MAFIGYRNDGKDERRLGRRVPVGDIPLIWSTPKSAGFGLRRALKGAVGTIVDVSLSGAAVTGPSRLPFEVGTTVLFQYEGHDCSAIVRRRQPTDDPSTDVLGLELVVVHPLLKRRIQQLVAEARTEVP
jgi:hypothetical protein